MKKIFSLIIGILILFTISFINIGAYIVGWELNPIELEKPEVIETDIIEENFIIAEMSNLIKITPSFSNEANQKINAIKCSINDENVRIYLKNENEDIFYETDNYNCISWTSNFIILDTSETENDKIIFEILDIQVEGKWQNYPLENNKITIYRYDKTALPIWDFGFNSLEKYRFKIQLEDSRITDFSIYSNNEELKLEYHGTYSIFEDGICDIFYKYSFSDGKSVKFKQSKEIMLLKIYPTRDKLYEVIDGKTYVYIRAEGTDVDVSEILGTRQQGGMTIRVYYYPKDDYYVTNYDTESKPSSGRNYLSLLFRDSNSFVLFADGTIE